ncbi:MAG: YceI family protein [Polyangiaceae bacterium]|jgi:polyisoprenoid-binding protein YceI|nr:YceI family protein [Polyangiaceae bacterium]
MKILLAAPLLLAFAIGCNDPAKDKPQATTDTAKAAAAPVQGTSYAFSGADSTFGFIGAKVTGSHEGSFKTFQGKVVIPGTDIEKGSVTVDVDATSVVTDSEKLTGHLKSPDFFDTEKFPKARFESTSVKKGGDGGATHTVTGNLTIRGVTKSVTFPVKAQLNGDAFALDAEFKINRKDFGIVYAGRADDLIKDDVVIKLAIKAKKG